MVLPLTVAVRLERTGPARLLVVYVPHHADETIRQIARRAAVTGQIVAHLHAAAARETQ